MGLTVMISSVSVPNVCQGKGQGEGEGKKDEEIKAWEIPSVASIQTTFKQYPFPLIPISFRWQCIQALGGTDVAIQVESDWYRTLTRGNVSIPFQPYTLLETYRDGMRNMYYRQQLSSVPAPAPAPVTVVSPTSPTTPSTSSTMSVSAGKTLEEKLTLLEEVSIVQDRTKRLAGHIQTTIRHQVTCPKCKGSQVIITSRQTRSADEPMTETVDCQNPLCKFHWRIA